MSNPGSNIFFSGQAISPNEPQKVQLKSGAVFLFPGGNYYVKPGAQTCLQWLDMNSGLWTTFEAGPVNFPILINSDGSNFRAINLSGTIVGANITTAGTLYTQANTTVTFAAPVAGGITATANAIIGGAMTLSVTGGSGGTGYTNPEILIPAPQLLGGVAGLCIPATANAAISSGVIGSITMGFGGAGYQSLPGSGTITVTPAQYQANPQYYNNQTNIVIIDPAGTGAQIIATAANGTSTSGGLTGIVMTNNGSLYDGTHIPAVTITSATGGSAAATALPSMALTSVTIGSTNTGYTASVLGITSLGSGAAAVVGAFGDPILPRRASFTCTQSGGVLQAALIEDAGNGFQTVPLAKQVGNATADGSVNATFTAVVGGVTNTLLFWQI